MTITAPTRPLRVVAVEAVHGGRGQEVLHSTRSNATAEQVIGWYATRWSIEVLTSDGDVCKVEQLKRGGENPRDYRKG